MGGSPPAQGLPADHLPARCCRHVFTAACPIDCLAAVLSTVTFHTLARAERAPFDPPATVGQVLELLRVGRLGLAFGLGPRRLGEIRAGLVLAGLVLSEDAPPSAGPPSQSGSPVRFREEGESPPC
jgi:hypothetical protein